MKNHESISSLLPLAAADALSLEEIAIVEEHALTCPECRRELNALRMYSRGLQNLPQPALPAGLLQRTTARLEQTREEAAERRWHNVTLCLLAMFSWTTGIASWLAVRAATSGVLVVFGVNLVAPGAWAALCTLLIWTTAGVAAVVLAKRNESLRRMI